MKIYRSYAALVASVAATLAVSGAASPTRAATEIRGDAASVDIRLENSSVDEALKSLGSSFELHYRAPGTLTKSLSGAYRGNLKEVVKHLLDGYDFVLTTRGSAIEVSVLGKSAKSGPVTAPDRTQSAAVKPAVVTQQAATANIGVKAASPASAPPAPASTDDAAVPQPILMAQNDPSKMPMPTITEGGAMPMPTPSTSGEGPVPRPDTSGSGPMPMPQLDASSNSPVPMPPTPMAQPASQPSQAAAPAPMPKPN